MEQYNIGQRNEGQRNEGQRGPEPCKADRIEAFEASERKSQRGKREASRGARSKQRETGQSSTT